jgi:hypothetical protein
MTYQASPESESAHAGDGAREILEGASEASEPTTSDASATPTTGPDAESTHDALLDELARAMHLAASSQYGRMNAELERRRTEHVEAIAARAAAEAQDLKAGSDADIGAIDAWAKAETEKIKLERLRRIDARREELAAQLERQETVKEREVFAIEVAVDAHRNEIDAFFGRMERESDPAAIAEVASTLPAFPPLAEIAENARRSAAAEFANLQASPGPAEAVTEPPTEAVAPGEPTATGPSTGASMPTPAGTGEDATDRQPGLTPVMDPDAVRSAEEARPWEAPYAVSVAAGPMAVEAPAVATTAAAEAPSGVGSTLLRTVRAIRPMSGDRHDRGSGEH